jgi:hypothetical protein
MPRAVDLLKQGRNEELWQMCCGFLHLNINEFMDIQKRLLIQQIELLNNCTLGKKIMHGKKPKTVEEFRQLVPLTTYKDYCPELLDKKEDTLPEKPMLWAHSSGKTGEYPCKWVPMSSTYASELSKTLYGVGILSGCDGRGDTSHIPKVIKCLYSVAPKPYISGTFADLLRMQSQIMYLPPIDEVNDITFEERIKLGFQQAMSHGFDYFFGLSMILVNVGEKISDSSNKVNLRPFLNNPGALYRLISGKIKSRLAGRSMLPRDLWKIKGIISSGVDSIVYKDKIEKLWGRKPLDLYACTEGGVIAAQAWDFSNMTFVPQLNFLEFIPEDEQLKSQMDRSYIPRTLLLDEVKAGKNYEIVITNFHGGIMTRYRIGDMVRIQSLSNEKLGISLPQMSFERRVDDIIDFVFVRLTEKSIWQAIENTGIPYVDWVAFKKPGEPILQICLELADGCSTSKDDIVKAIQKQITKLDDNDDKSLMIRNDFSKFIEFKLEVTLLPCGSFNNYIAQRQAEGADLAHLKPPHVNPSERVLSLLTAENEEIIIVTKAKAKESEKNDAEKVEVN